MGSDSIAGARLVTPQDKRFFKKLGARLAEQRKHNQLTQVQLAEILNISQQTLAHYEVGRLRVPASMLPTLARLFATSVDELLGINHAKGKRGPAPKLQRQIEQLQQLPKTKQRFVMEMLDTVLQQSA